MDFSDRVNFFVNLMVFAEKPVAALLSAFERRYRGR